MALAVVRDLRERGQSPLSIEDVEAFEQDVLAGFVLARASAGLSDRTISIDTSGLVSVREWFGRPLWELMPADMDRYFGKHLRGLAVSTKAQRAQSLSTFFEYLQLRHKVEIYEATGVVIESPLDEVNRPRGRGRLNLRVPPTRSELEGLFAGWRTSLGSARKFATAARNYVSSRLMSQVGLRINEIRMLDLLDVKWELGTFGKLHVRFGKGSGGRGPKQRMVPLINGARELLVWYVQEVRGLFDDDWALPGACLFPSERRGGGRPSSDSLRDALDEAVLMYLPSWRGALTPHVLRHYCASSLYQEGMDIVAIQELLGHEWIATTMGYVPRPSHTHRGRLATGGGTSGTTVRRMEIMIWNLRMAAAKRDIWRASDMQRLLAEYGLVISKGKMSNLWSGKPVTLRLDDLDVICKVLECGPGELLLPEPDKILRQTRADVELRQAAGISGIRPQPRPRGYRSLPPT